ncbi:MAG: hypothetical protein WDN25_30050 [Acetobacteraceae bacterium]
MAEAHRDQSEKPLIVYLDSSDFSNMANPKNAEGQRTLEHLRTSKREGRIAPVFSAFHLIELAHIDAASKDAAQRRADIVLELCGDRCFTYWTDLVNCEARHLAFGSAERSSREDAIRDDGVWFPPLTGIARGFKQAAFRDIEKLIASNSSSRAERRKIKSNFVSGGWIRKRHAAIFDAPDIMESLRANLRDWPLTDRFRHENFFAKYLMGSVSENEFNSEMQKSISNVRNFVGHYYDRIKDEDKAATFGWLRDLGTTIIDLYSDLRSKSSAAAAHAGSDMVRRTLIAEVSGPKGWIARLRERILRSVYEADPSIATRVNEDQWQTRVVQSKLGAIPALDAVMIGLESHTLTSLQGDRTLRRSDIGDIFHFAYLPYVDIFRCDRYASELTRRLTDLFGASVTSRISTLLAEV